MKIGKVSNGFFYTLIGVLTLYIFLVEPVCFSSFLGPLNRYSGQTYLIGSRLSNFKSGDVLQTVQKELDFLNDDEITNVEIEDLSARWSSVGFAYQYPTTVLVEYMLEDDRFELAESKLAAWGFEACQTEYMFLGDRTYGDFVLYYRCEDSNTYTILALNPVDHRVILSVMQYQLTDAKSDRYGYILTIAELNERLYDSPTEEYILQCFEYITGTRYRPGEGIWATEGRKDESK